MQVVHSAESRGTVSKTVGTVVPTVWEELSEVSTRTEVTLRGTVR